MLIYRDINNSAPKYQCQQKLPIEVDCQEYQAAKQTADYLEKKMTQLMVEAEHMEKKRKQSLEFKNLRIQLTVEVAKSKAQLKILEATSKVPDDAQATLKCTSSYLD